MVIRRPVAEVFEAFVDPASRPVSGSPGAPGDWRPVKRSAGTGTLYGVSKNVDVKAIERNRRIVIEWDGPDNPTSVEWKFEAIAKDRTLVVIRNWGFHGDADKIVADAIDSTGGFSFVLAGLKAFAEHHIELNLVRDHQPAIPDGLRLPGERADWSQRWRFTAVA